MSTDSLLPHYPVRQSDVNWRDERIGRLARTLRALVNHTADLERHYCRDSQTGELIESQVLQEARALVLERI